MLLQTQPGLKHVRFSDSVDCKALFSTASVMFTLLMTFYVMLFVFVLKLLGNIQVHQDFEDTNKPLFVVRNETL